MPSWAERASHIDPPTSSDAIMRKACPYRGENPGPGKDVHRELDPKPGIRELAYSLDGTVCVIQVISRMPNGR